MGFWLIRLGSMTNSERLGFPTFVALDKGEASLEEFDEEVGWLPVLPVVELPQLPGEMLEGVVRRKSATAGGTDGLGWRELTVLPVAWFNEFARILIYILL